jgi:AAA+ ATPase superfamily predicted ATPase
METAFVYGKVVGEDNFTNREKDMERLLSNFENRTNTILISPRRWGKSSLVAKAAEKAHKKNKTLRFCFIDLYNLRSEEQFYEQFALEVLKASSSKVEELTNQAFKFIGRMMPKIIVENMPGNEVSLGLDWKEVRKNPDDILNLPENLSRDKKFRFVICIDEFQNIAGFEDHVAFQKKLRSHWQKHSNTTYCLYGSKRSMMMDVFTSSNMPFYKFGDILFLEKITREDWLPFIMKRFKDTGKGINPEAAGAIIDLADCHSYYVQQLAQQAWLRTKRICNSEIVAEAHDGMVLQMSLLFQTITDSLSNTQVNFLKALICGEKQLSSVEVLQTYRLGSSANVTRIREALVSKEIVEVQNKEYVFLDPVYRFWLKKFYFRV